MTTVLYTVYIQRCTVCIELLNLVSISITKESFQKVVLNFYCEIFLSRKNITFVDILINLTDVQYL